MTLSGKLTASQLAKKGDLVGKLIESAKGGRSPLDFFTKSLSHEHLTRLKNSLFSRMKFPNLNAAATWLASYCSTGTC